MKYEIVILTLAFILTVGVLYSLNLNLEAVQGLSGAPQGTQSYNASTSAIAVFGYAHQIFSTSTCMARIITSSSTALYLTFGDEAGQSPTTGFSHQQAANTTAVYDSAVYGCGLWKAVGTAPSTITVTEFTSFR